MARKSDGSTALAAVVGYLVFKGVGDAMSPVSDASRVTTELINYGVLGGIVMGLVSAWLWQRYHRISLPPYLAFFGGRRFVPIITAFAAVVISVADELRLPGLRLPAITGLGEWVTDNAVLGGFVYGTLNRLLIPLGLHHILNNPPWFIFGEYSSGGETYNGDIARFLAGDPTAGAFMTGFFPIMMFALPAAALAIWHEAKPQQQEARRRHHALGRADCVPHRRHRAARVRVHVRRVPALRHPRPPHRHLDGADQRARASRTGSASRPGLFDYVLNFNIATKPLLLIPIGLAYAALYYFLFRFVIRKWNLRTPGREDEDDPAGGGSILEQDNKA